MNFKNILTPGSQVEEIEVQPDGKILVAGNLATRGAVFRRNVVRLDADGSVDATFNFTAGSNIYAPTAMKLLPNGKILVGGAFDNASGQPNRKLARLNADGSLDTTFAITGISPEFVSAIELQPDGKILIMQANFNGGTYTTRLNADGSVETRNGVRFYFDHEDGLEMQVTFLPNENKILLTGNFTYTVNQTTYKGVARYNLDGTIDTTFAANVTTTSQYYNVYAVPLAGGKILIYGSFEAVNGVVRRNIAVLNNNGSLDASFNPRIDVNQINTAAVQANGKIIVDTFSFAARYSAILFRLNADGTIDNTFYSGRGLTNGGRITFSNVLKIRGDDKLLIGGRFYRYHIFPRSGLVQINL
ncbi:MAG: delta-60 repeat domain-containing protein [Pyrinomonadaceae bacterium]